jgi:tRNA (mo5U34)-methyltransferase
MWNIEESTPGSQDINCDVLHHVGVLYHLLDPVSHLIEIAGAVRRGIMLDTHYARAEEATSSYEIRGRSYAVKEYRESGYVDVFSGMYPMSRWLTLDDLSNILKEAGFAHVEIAQRRDERNGARALIFAER